MTLEGLKVSGKYIVGVTSGNPVRLRGVCAGYGSTYTYMTNQGAGDPCFAYPHDLAQFNAMKQWGCNCIRLQVCQDGWLNTNAPFTFGALYQNPMIAFAQAVLTAGMYLIVSFCPSALFPREADAGTVTMIQQWFTAFGDDTRVVYELVNEPNGVTFAQLKGGYTDGGGHVYVGTTVLVAAFRAAGYTSILSVPGINFSGDLTAWIANIPVDSASNLCAYAHMYGAEIIASPGQPITINPANALSTVYFAALVTVAASYPVIVSECNGQQTFSNTPQIASDYLILELRFFEAYGIHYTPFAWNAFSMSVDFNDNPHNDTFQAAKIAGKPSLQGDALMKFLKTVSQGGVYQPPSRLPVITYPY